MEILAEAKALQQLGISLPGSVTTLLSQERRIKQFHQLLQQTLDELYTTVEGIDARMKPLFQPLVEMVTRFVYIKWSCLSVQCCNVNICLHLLTI